MKPQESQANSPSDTALQAGDAAGRSGLRWLLLCVLAIAAVLGFFYREHLTLANLAQYEASLRAFQLEHPVLILLLAFALYVLVTGLSIPGATGLTLVYAWFFGFWTTLILVSFASTTGATMAFLLSRFLFRDAIQRRFGHRLQAFNEALDREGALYLFSLRLIPAVPFFVINVVMGLTRIRTWTYWWVSQIGMLAGTCAYVYAGASFPDLATLAEPALMRSSDVANWSQLAASLRLPDETDFTGSLRSQLTQESQDLLENWPEANSVRRDEAQKVLLADLNHLISTRDFLAEMQAIDPQDEKAHSKTKKNNRAELVKHLPGLIRPPQPLVRPQLLIAFAVLGLFPIVAKKGLAFVRRGFGESG